MIDYSVYLVTDRRLARGRTLAEVIEPALLGGVTCVQLREKDCDTVEFIYQALAVRELLARRGVPLIINDRLDVALAVEADGVHLGQKDMPCRLARKILPRRMVIGVSAECAADAEEAQRNGADYIGVSPIYATPTKTDTAPPLGLEGLAEIRSLVDLPLVAIGGLNSANAAEAINFGADGVAVVSDIVAAADPERAARNLARAVGRAKRDWLAETNGGRAGRGRGGVQ